MSQWNKTSEVLPEHLKPCIVPYAGNDVRLGFYDAHKKLFYIKGKTVYTAVRVKNDIPIYWIYLPNIPEGE